MMPTVKEYQRNDAVKYARKWAYERNPAYYDFSNLGGNCTNFISQCLYAGSKVMNTTPNTGWYYYSANNRAPAWTGVKFLHRFLVNNTNKGVFAKEVAIDEIMIGDVIQLGDETGIFYHSLLVTQVGREPAPSNILICANTFNAKDRVLSSYSYHKIRYLHIEGIYL